MPKNKGKGGKNRRRGKNENESEKRELIFKEDEQEYAQVTKMLGNGRLEAMCFDGVKRLCHIRGKLRKKVCDGFPLRGNRKRNMGGYSLCWQVFYSFFLLLLFALWQ